MKVVDLRGVLPYEERFDAGTFAGKTTTTGHWPGIPIDPELDDVAAIELIERLAQGHIDRDWSAIFGQQGGAGLMYHEVLAPSGTLFVTRDPDAIVWHAEAERMLMAGNPNTTSHALLVLYSSGLTPAQRTALAAILPARPRPTYGNSEWMGTACPGPELLALIRTYRLTGRVATEEDEMDQVTFDRMALDWWRRAADQGGAGGVGTIEALKRVDEILANSLRLGHALDTQQEQELRDLRVRIAELGGVTR